MFETLYQSPSAAKSFFSISRTLSRTAMLHGLCLQQRRQATSWMSLSAQQNLFAGTMLQLTLQHKQSGIELVKWVLLE